MRAQEFISENTLQFHSDQHPRLQGLTFHELHELSESAGDDFSKFDQAIKKNLNLDPSTNTLEIYGVYVRKLAESRSGKRLLEGKQTAVEQALFRELSQRSQGSIDSASVGDRVALLDLSTLNIPGHKVVARLDGFLNPKQIVNITESGNFQQLEFADGSRYPERDHGDIFQQTQSWNMTKLFPTSDAAARAHAFYALVGRRMSDDLDFQTRVDQSITEGAPELLQAQMPLVRHIQRELAKHGYVKGTSEYNTMFKHQIAFYRKFGNIDAIRQSQAPDMVNEIGYSDQLGNLNVPEAEIIAASTVDGKISQKPVMKYEKGNTTMFFFADHDKISALVLLSSGNKLQAIKNFSGQPGQIYALINYIVNFNDRPLVITPDEPLTPEGFKWVAKLIDNTPGVKVSDMNGNPIDIKALHDSWMNSKLAQGTKSGPTGIIISELSKSWKNKLIENESRLMPHLYFDVTGKKAQGVTEAEGDAQGLPHLTPALASHIADQIDSQGPHAVVKSVTWGDGAARELLLRIKEMLDDYASTMSESAAWQRKAGKSKSGGLNARGVASYRREHPGSKLQMAVTTKPSKLKKGSKAAQRRKSFCARMGGMRGPMKDEHGKPTRKALALRKWNCESVEQFEQMIESHLERMHVLQESLRTENPCWSGYHPVGTKKKHGKTVPNCVPNPRSSKTSSS